MIRYHGKFLKEKRNRKLPSGKVSHIYLCPVL
jgi:hypothetical protein